MTFASAMWDGEEHIVKIPDVLAMGQTALVTVNAIVQRTSVLVRMAGLVMAAIFRTVLEILTVLTGVTAMKLLTLQSVPIVYLVGWVRLVRISVRMVIKYLWTVETVFVIHVTQGAVATSNAQDTGLVSTINATVIQFKGGGALYARCQGAQVRVERTVVGMANVIVQTISASVNQVGQVQVVISQTVRVFQTALVVDTAMQQTERLQNVQTAMLGGWAQPATTPAFTVTLKMVSASAIHAIQAVVASLSAPDMASVSTTSVNVAKSLGMRIWASTAR